MSDLASHGAAPAHVLLGGPGTFARLSRGFARLTGAMAACATVWIFVLMFAICADVIGLKIFSAPIYGVVEITGQSIVAVVFLQLAHALNTGRLTRADFLIDVLERGPSVPAAVLNVVFHAMGCLLFALIAWTVSGDFVAAFQEGEFFGTRGVFTAPMWPIKLMVALGAAATAVEFAIQTLAWCICTRRRLRLGVPEARAGMTALVVVLCTGAVIAGLFWSDLGRVEVGLVLVAALLVLIVSGMHIAVVLMGLSFLGVWLIRDNPMVAVRSVQSAVTGSINKFEFGVVPLFVLMGLLVDVSDVGRDAYKVAAWSLRRIRGGLGVATVAANAVFAAVTGISIASAAVFSRLAVPQMVKHGYAPSFAAGTVAGSSVLGMLIPPSLLLIIYGFVSETSVGQLFLAAVIPGIVLALVFVLLIVGIATVRPDLVGGETAADDIEPETFFSAMVKLLPIAFLILVIVGGIYTGWFTPTQAGAVGAAAALGVALLRRKLDLAALWRVLQETAQISVTILILIVAASAFTRMLAMSTIPNLMVDFIMNSGFGLWGFMMAYLLVVIIKGMFLDSTSIILIVVPLSLGVVDALGRDVIGPDVLIWFGVVTVVAVEIGLLTPPFGITVYVVRSSLSDMDITLWQVFRGAFPFVIAMVFVALLLIFVPALSLMLL